VSFACFRPYVGQPDNHIGWATSMPFSSIYPTHSRTNIWNCFEKILGIGGFESIILDIFCFALSPLKSDTNYGLEWIGINFHQAKRVTTFWPRPNITTCKRKHDWTHFLDTRSSVWIYKAKPTQKSSVVIQVFCHLKSNGFYCFQTNF
jgi:hypothetical protein